MAQDKLLRILYWILFIGLCGLSAQFTWEVFEKFSSEDTSFKVREEPIYEHPTVTICFSENYEYGKDFNITHQHLYQNNGKYHNEKILLTQEMNIFNASNEIIYLKKLITLYNGICYKIVPTTKNIFKGEMKAIEIYFDDTISSKKMPSAKFYFSSEKNSYGILMNTWMDGDALEVNVDKYVLTYSLKPEKYIYINTSKSVCSNKSFYQCFSDKVSADNFEHCPTKCSTISLPFQNASVIPVCEKEEDQKCSLRKIIHPIFNRINDKELCPRSCTFLQYSGKIVHKYEIKNQSTTNVPLSIWYSFKVPESVMVNEQYLIYDAIGMIGAVGGTLGMCIGFSFDSIIHYLINLLPSVLRIIKNIMYNKV